MSTRAAPRSSAVAALSQAEAPPPSMAMDLPRSATKSMSSLVWAAKIGHQSAIDEIRPEYATGSCTAGRQNDPPRQYVSTYPAFIQHGPNEGSCGFECFQRSPMPDWQSQHFLQPGQILNPGPIMNLVKRFPGIDAVFRLIPGTKGERGNAEGGARQCFGRAQRVHPRAGQPRPFLARP